VSYQDYESDDQENADAVSDNSISSWSELDLSGINTDLADFDPSFDIDLLGIKDFVLEPAEKLPMCDEDAVPENVPAKSVLGDLYILGNHRVMCSDNTMIDQVEKLMNGEKADMVFTDPPYNVASDSTHIASKGDNKWLGKAHKNLSKSEWDKDFDIIPSLNSIMSICADSVTVYVWTSQFLIQKIWDHLNEWCDFTGYCVWSKTNPMPSLSKRHWTFNSELVVYATRGTKRVVNFPDGENALSVWSIPKKSDGTHPTQKPIYLCEHAIKFSSGEHQLIIDLFGGSGSTLIACQKTNRKCYMMELDPHYIDVIVSRWCKYTGNKKVIRNGEEIEWETEAKEPTQVESQTNN